MPPHVTLLVPFVHASRMTAETLDIVAEVVAAFALFPFALARVGRFETVVYLAPEPADPFVRMTSSLVRVFPEQRPYEDAFEEVVPHLTVATGNDKRLLDEVERQVETALPIKAQADHVALVERGASGTWETRATFPLRAPR
jgi:2'-5' RNA ligase